MKNFQLITIVVFIAFAVFGVFVFSGAIPLGGGSNNPGRLGTVVLWGTARGDVVSPLIADFNTANPSFTVEYVQKSRETLDRDLLEALASGRGPDMFFLPDDLVLQYADRIFPIPYQSFSLASFRGAFAGAGEVFLSSGGTLAFPVSVDPLMMYYNRSMLDANSVVFPPESWDQLLALVPTLNEKDDANKIIKSAVALGHFSNVTHAKEILATLFMQSGNKIVGEKNGALVSVLDSSSSGQSAAQVLRFYTSFADPSSSVYSWNRSFPSSADAFSREDLALYFGFGSEFRSLVNKNPNQNFSVAPFPQLSGSNFKHTTARVSGIALLSSSRNLNTAFTAANAMALGDFADKLARAQGVAPARRDLLGVVPEDAYSPIFYQSALYARGWLDPSPRDTADIFRQMIDGVLSNSATPSQAVKSASSRLDFLLLK